MVDVITERWTPNFRQGVVLPPKLAIVITCYNYERFVERAIRSYLDQARNDCEIVVVDDGSTDSSWQIIRQTGVAAIQITNRGQRAACLVGLQQTIAPHILFLDADDELAPGALATIVQRLDAKVAKLQFPLAPIDSDGKSLGAPRPTMKDFRDSKRLADEVLKTGVYTTPPTSGNVFRRDLCELLKDADYDTAVDGVTLFAAPFFGDVVSISEPLGRYRIHDRNDSGVGRAPQASLIRRDLMRFLSRMHHLRQVLQQRDANRRLVDPRKVYWYREGCFWLAICSGVRPPISALPGLLSALARQRMLFRKTVAMGAIFIAASFLSSRRAKALLDLRARRGEPVRV